VQSRYDMIVFGLVAAGSFSSGGLLTAFGWTMVLWVSLLPLVAACVVLALAPRRAEAAS
jgi:predicted MFS family arabinose efflux permease